MCIFSILMQEGWILLMNDSMMAVGGGYFIWLVGAFFIIVHMIMSLVSCMPTNASIASYDSLYK
jgi:hypothetical protein